MVFIFLSYKSDDEKIAKKIKEVIERRFPTKVFMSTDATNGTTVGKIWPPEIYEAMQQSDIVIFLISKKWIDSNFCQDEFRLAQYMGRTTVPLILEKFSEVEDFVQKHFNDKTFITLNEIFDSSNKIKTDNKLFSQLEKAIEGSIFPPFEYNKDNPYKGLLAYREDDAGVFFGRENEIKELKNKILAKQAKIYIIRGHSGVGKSSFMQAGILARMRAEKEWRVFSVYTPEIYDPIGSFAEYIASNTNQDITSITQILSSENIETIVEKLYKLIKTTNHVLIPIDQAELLVMDDSNAMVKKVQEVYLELVKRTSIYGIVTIRNDLFDKLQYYIDEKIKDDVELKSISYNEIDKVIRLPIQIPAYRMKGYKIDDEFVRIVKEDIDYSADMLPLLSALLEKLFNEHKGKLTKEVYRKGDIKNHINDMAESIVDTLEEEKLESLKKFLLFRLVRYLKAIDSYILTQASLEMIPHDIQDVIDKFIEKRLLIKDKKSIKIAHESVLRHWQRLKEWIEKEREILNLLEEIDRYYETYWKKSQEKIAKKKLNDYLLPKSIVNALEDDKKYEDVINASDKKEYIAKSVNYYKKEALKRRGFLITSFAAISGLAVFGNIQYFRAKENEKRALTEAKRANLNELKMKEELERARHNLGLAFAQRAKLYFNKGYLLKGNVYGYRALKLLNEKYDFQNIKKEIQSLLYLPDNFFVPTCTFKEAGLVSKVCFSKDNKKIIIVKDKGIFIKNIKTRKMVQSCNNPFNKILEEIQNCDNPIIDNILNKMPASFEIAPNFKKMAFSTKKDIFIINVDENFKLSKKYGSLINDFPISSCSFFQNDKNIVCGLDNGYIHVWDIENLRPLPLVRIKAFNNKKIYAIATSKKYIASSGNKTIKIWDNDLRSFFRVISEDFSIRKIAISPDENKIAYLLNNNILKIKNIKYGDFFQAIHYAPNDGDGIDLAFSRDNKQIVCAFYNDYWEVDETTIYILRQKNNPLVKVQNISSSISIGRILAIAPNGKNIIYMPEYGKAGLYNLESNVSKWLDIHENMIYDSFSFSPDSKEIIVSIKKINGVKFNNIIQVRDSNTGDLMFSISDDGALIRKVVLSPDKKQVVSVSNQCIKKIWDIKSHRLILSEKIKSCREDTAISIAIFQYGEKIAFGFIDGTVQIIKNNNLSQTFKIHNNNVFNLVFSPDGKKIASISSDGIKIWNSENGEVLLTFQEDVPTAISFSQDGKEFMYIKHNKMRVLNITKIEDPKFISQQIKKFENYLQMQIDG